MSPARAIRLLPESDAALSVSELTALIKGLLEGAPALRDLWVAGEVSNFKHHTSGHMYFTLKDEAAVLRCVMFRAQAERVPFRPQNGLRVLVRGRLGVFERDGAYQCYAQQMAPAGLGSLHLAFEQLKARLAAEGLFAEAAKRPLPRLPRLVAVVTSPTGAAWQDILRVAQHRCPSVGLVLVPALVQGVDAPASLLAALSLAPASGAEVVVLARGGGSLEELWAFNDEALARAIRACPLPVVAGVGHETDFTIADFAADRRAPTPSGAAELVVPERAALRAELAAKGEAARRATVVRLQRLRQRLAAAARGPLSRPEAAFTAQRLRLGHVSVRLQGAGRLRVDRGAAEWRTAAGRLHALSPLGVLSRGFAVCRLPDGRLVRRPADAPLGTAVEVLVERGRLRARVEGHGPALEPLAMSGAGSLGG